MRMASMFGLGAVLLPGVACGSEATKPGEASPSAAVAALEPDTSKTRCADDEVARGFQEHACLHAESGPFASVTASLPAGAPSVSKSHTAYEVLFPNPDERWVSFQTKKAGVFALYTDPKARLALRKANGDRVAMSCEGPTTDACAILAYQVQARLDANESVYIAVFTESAPSIQLVIERVE